MRNFKKIYIVIFLVICFLFLFPKKFALSSNVYHNKIFFTELKIIKVTFILINEVDNYIKTYAKDSKVSAEKLVNICDEYDMDLKLTLAQAHLESHFGTQGTAVITNSIFNVGTYDNGKILYRYNDPNDSIEPYIYLIQSKYLIDKKVEDLYHTFENYEGKRYASSETYEYQLRKIIERINYTSIDSLLTVRKKLNLSKYL